MNPAADNGGDDGRVAVKQACTVLYNKLPPLESAPLRLILQRLVGPCEVEWGGTLGPNKPMVAGVVRYEEHEVVLIAFNTQVSDAVLSRTVGVSPMPEDQRQLLLSHRAAIRALYMKGSDSPVEQLTALYQVATALISQGGIGLLNERAALAQPVELLLNYLPLRHDDTEVPLPLWVGVVTFGMGESVDGTPQRYLMRTYGLEQFGVSELGIYLADRSIADDVYDVLLNFGLYLVEGGDKLNVAPGHRAEFRSQTYLFTDPDQQGVEFASPTGLLLLVPI